jgi:ubiquinone/menaquinone biosynthesis C-methylase UbiE
LIGSQAIAGLNAIGHSSQFAVRTRKFSKVFYRKVLGKKRWREISELSTSGIHQAVLRAIAAVPAMPSSGDHLDVGSGTGELLRLVRAHYPFCSFGCDYTDKLLSVPSTRSI